MHFIKDGHYYKITKKVNNVDKYYRIINPRKLFLFTLIPTPDDATVTLSATGYQQTGNSMFVIAGTIISWSVSKSGLETKTGTITVNGDTTLNVAIGYQSGTIIFESSTPGTYPITLGYSQNYSIILVGAGGKGAKYHGFGTGAKASAAGGGSGAYVYGSLFIQKGDYSAVVGGANGGQSSVFDNIARGGGNGSASSVSSATGGSGGTYTTTFGVSGIKGNAGGSAKNASAASANGGSSLYGGYGAGGSARGASKGTEYANDGKNGYVKIVAA